MSLKYNSAGKGFQIQTAPQTMDQSSTKTTVHTIPAVRNKSIATGTVHCQTETVDSSNGKFPRLGFLTSPLKRWTNHKKFHITQGGRECKHRKCVFQLSCTIQVGVDSTHVYVRKATIHSIRNDPFLESVVATFHLIALEADKGSANESRDEKNSADKAPTMETSTGRLS